MIVHVRAHVDVRVETRQAKKRTERKQLVVTRNRTSLLRPLDVNVKHDYHPQPPTTGGAQPYAKRINL